MNIRHPAGSSATLVGNVGGVTFRHDRSRKLRAVIATFSVLLLSNLCAAPAQAQSSGQPSVQTLAQALDAAWLRDPRASALPGRQDEARARLERANGLTAGPAAVSVSQLSDQLNRNQGWRELEVEVSAPLWLPGQKSARAAEAGQAIAEVDARAAALRLQLAGELREAWWTLAGAREGLTLARQRVDSARVLEQAVQRRFRSGDLARIDANLARAETLAAEGDLLDADAAVALAEQNWRLSTGVAAPADLAPEAEVDQAIATDVDPARHPLLQALQAGVDLAASHLATLAASRRDAPELAVRWTRQRSSGLLPYEAAIGVKLTLPLSLDGQVRQDSSAARAELAQADAELAQARVRIQLDLPRARAALDMARQQLALARERRALSADDLQLAQRAFALGESDLAALLRARTAAQQAESAFKRQELACFQARSRLYQAQGVLP